MRSWNCLAILLCTSLFAQTPAPAPGTQGIEIIEVKPDTVIATVNGKAFTAGEFEMLIPNLPQNLRDLAATKPKEFLEQYALGLTLQAEAEKIKLDQQFPYRQKISDARRQILVQGMMEEKAKALKIDPEESKKIFESRRSGYQQAKTKVIFCSRMGYTAKLDGSGRQEYSGADAKKKVDKAITELREGKDFVAVAKQYSDDTDTLAKDADFPYPIRANSNQVPQNIRDAVLAGSKGEIVGPIELDTGWYIFRIEQRNAATFDEVKPEIEKELRDQAVRKFVDETRKKSTVTLDHQPFWNTFLAANREAQERAEKQAQEK